MGVLLCLVLAEQRGYITVTNNIADCAVVADVGLGAAIIIGTDQLLQDIVWDEEECHR